MTHEETADFYLRNRTSTYNIKPEDAQIHATLAVLEELKAIRELLTPKPPRRGWLADLPK